MNNQNIIDFSYRCLRVFSTFKVRGHLPSISTSLRITANDRIFFSKQLAVLIAAEVPLPESLELVRTQTPSRSLSTILDSVITDVKSGKSLSKSLSKYPHAVGSFTIGVVAIGEASGTLAQNVAYIADELKKRQKLRQKIVGALIYPALITAATLILSSFLVIYLFPKLMPIFLSLNTPLPLSTRIIMSISQFLIHYGLMVGIGTLLLITALLILHRHHPPTRYVISVFSMRIPILKTLLRDYHLAQGLRSLGLLLKSGMPLSSALFMLANLTQQLLYQKEWARIAREVHRGGPVSAGLQSRPDLFSRTAVQMVAVGERSGDLPQSLMYIADMYELELDEHARTLSTLLEPLLMIGMGLVIGVVAISIMTPIYGLTQHLQS